MFTFYLKLLVIYIGSPIAVISWMMFAKGESRFNWIIKSIMSIAYILYLVLAVEWRVYSHYVKYIIIGVLAIGLILSYIKHKRLPLTVEESYRKWFFYRIAFFTSILLIYKIGVIVKVDEGLLNDRVELQFPLKNGTYSIAQVGNNSKAMFYNRINKSAGRTIVLDNSQKYSLDIVKLNDMLIDSEKIMPALLEDYEIYQESLYSPCNGEVVEIRDSLEDEYNRSGARIYNEGNYIIIRNSQGYYVKMENLKKGSILVRENDVIKQGQEIGKVGNSSVSSYPHLHIYVTKSFDLVQSGVRISFDGKETLANRVFRK